MPNVRPINEKKYDISKRRFMELYYHCLQYNEWLDELKYKTDTVKSMQITDMPSGHGTSDATCNLATRRLELRKKCEAIEQTAIEASAELYQYIIKAVTNEGITYTYLTMKMDLDISHNTWYKARRRFYWLLDRRM